MGLQSALTTSLTGLQAAETVIDVVGNNVANSGTVGFKESDVLFANQFLQTQSIGSAPTDDTGGTNPRQIGLGVKVAAINPDFTQGTIQISSNPLDVAIQGDGFLLVEGFQGEQLFTRNGQLQTNSQNEIVTATGNRVLGLTVDEDFNIIPNLDAPVPISIPLGVPVAQSTSEAVFTGNLTPNADIGTNGVVTMQALGDSTVEFPEDASGPPDNVFDDGEFQIVDAPVVNTSTATPVAGGTLTAGTTYQYRVVWFVNSGSDTYESPASVPLTATPAGANLTVHLDNLPTDAPATSIWDGRRLYRSSDGGTTFNQIGADLDLVDVDFDDTGLVDGPRVLDDSALQQEEYSYYVTFFSQTNNFLESRPTQLVGPFSVDSANNRIRIDNLPQPAGTADEFDHIRIYRNLGNAPSEFHLVDTIDLGVTTYIDSKSDLDIAGQPQIDLLGAKASATTPLTDVVIRNGDAFIKPFAAGTLSFTGTKGGRTLAAKELEITADVTNVGDLRSFMDQTYGIDGTLGDGAGVALNGDGELVITSNAGIANELGADTGAFRMTPTGEQTLPVSIGFEQTIEAEGQGTTTTFVAFDALGEPVNVRLTTVRVASELGTDGATYRWFATSEDNEPVNSVDTFLDSGELVFDLNGNLIDPADGLEQISIDHPATNQLRFNLNFNSISGLAVTDSQNNPVSSMSLARQDGFPTGTLTSFTITESGLIRGVFSNGAERSLGQLIMAKFANPTGLQQVGNNMFAQGINSGEPLVNLPGSEGLGTLTSGAVELSNSDIGQNLIELILASTQYRGGARVITTTQQLLEELLNLRR